MVQHTPPIAINRAPAHVTATATVLYLQWQTDRKSCMTMVYRTCSRVGGRRRWRPRLVMEARRGQWRASTTCVRQTVEGLPDRWSTTRSSEMGRRVNLGSKWSSPLTHCNNNCLHRLRQLSRSIATILISSLSAVTQAVTGYNPHGDNSPLEITPCRKKPPEVTPDPRVLVSD